MVGQTTGSLDDGSGSRVRAVAGSLRVVFPRHLRSSHLLSGSSITIGRQAPSTILIPDATVSRRHAEVSSDGAGEHVVRDLGSRHGTLVEGASIGAAPRRLRDGTLIRIGDVLLVYEREPVEPVDAPHVELPGDAWVMKRLRYAVAAIARDPAPALITGDTGTGKEWVARELHRLSARAGAFVAVNCATLSAHLAESQLFGHVRGAFSGAVADHDGWFQQANGGTLLLDEIGELPLELQAKLLRVVQDRVVQPLGKKTPTVMDVRICAATNRDLRAEVESGRFRRDLHARLARHELAVPNLAARRGDLLDWFDRLWATWFRERELPVRPLSFRPGAATALVRHIWSDNLRGLDKLVHELAISPNEPTDVDTLPPWVDPAAAAVSAEGAEVDSVRLQVPTKEEFLEAWRTHNSVRALAKLFHRDRRQIYRWLAAYGVARPTEED